MPETLIFWKSVAIFSALVFFFAVERLIPKAIDKVGNNRLFRNAGLWLTTIPVSPLIIVPVTALAAANPLWQRPDWWSGIYGLLLDLLLLDLWIYWMHRSFHEVPFLWRFHEIHHRDEFLDATSAMRFHFGEVILSAMVRAPFIVLLAFPLSSVLIFEGVAMILAIFQHSNVKLWPRMERALSWFVITPSIHWIHHHTLRSDTNSNYGNIFSWWDRLFGSSSKTARTPDLPIGLDDADDIPLTGLLLQPFKGRQKKHARDRHLAGGG